MKMWRVGFTFLLVGWLLTGCGTTPTRFSEASSANVVLQYNSWEYTFMTQPAYQEGGFLLPVPRERLAALLDQMQVRQRKLAVVVSGWGYTPERQQQLVAEWNMLLRGCGFERVVVVKSNGSKNVNGSLIIDDSKSPSGSALTRF